MVEEHRDPYLAALSRRRIFKVEDEAFEIVCIAFFSLCLIPDDRRNNFNFFSGKLVDSDELTCVIRENY